MRKLLTICCAAAVLLLGSTEGYAFDAEDLENLQSTGSCPNCDLRDANLWIADLEKADLRGADLRRTDLYGANLQGAKLDSDGLAIARASGAIGLDPAGSEVANVAEVPSSQTTEPESDLIKKVRKTKFYKYVGKGKITFSPKAKEKLKRFDDHAKSAMFFVTKDGQHPFYTWCSVLFPTVEMRDTLLRNHHHGDMT